MTNEFLYFFSHSSWNNWVWCSLGAPGRGREGPGQRTSVELQIDWSMWSVISGFALGIARPAASILMN